MTTNHRNGSKHDLPFVFLNVAMTADGKIATANRAVSSFGSRHDLEHLLELRTLADAVMSGARTVDLNPVTLGPGAKRFRKIRLRNGLSEYNLRIIVSGTASIDPNAAIFRHRFSPIIILTSERATKQRIDRLRSVGAEVKICGDGEIDFIAALRWLKTRWSVNRLLCEGGGEVNAALIQAGLADELHLTICPKIVGGRNAPTIADGANVFELGGARHFKRHSVKQMGAEMFLVYRRAQ